MIRQAVATGRETFGGYGRHAGSQLAAGLAYRVLFSLVPLLALVVSLLFEGFRPTPLTVAGAAIAGAGNLLMLRPARSRRPAARAAAPEAE